MPRKPTEPGGRRTPAEVIALALEDNGLTPVLALECGEAASARLASVLRAMSHASSEEILIARPRDVLDWDTVTRQI